VTHRRFYALEQLAVAFAYSAWGVFVAVRIFRRCPCPNCS
jgi:hypothetical protein